jgi:4a-hydroxytetrahydrobiopterin dehydratase
MLHPKFRAKVQRLVTEAAYGHSHRMSHPRLARDEDIHTWLTTHEGWVRDGSAIGRAYAFPDFSSALAFVVRVACLAEKKNHHPDIELGWGKVGVRWTTHDSGGITELDLDLAADTDALRS